ncbi:MAG: RsmB/NOP family class I SAM-dependent RNA methyltransferase [Caulobacterales bacterium]|jgi:16S rRNA (cytosine967-C5)-methyltransferase
MRIAARASAAIEILSDMEQRRRPPADAIKDWMLKHRFAGAKDRAAIGDLVFGALRWKASSAWRLSADSPRAWVIGALAYGFAGGEETFALWGAEPHAPEALSAAEQEALNTDNLGSAPDHVRGDYPDWLDASLARVFGDERAAEGAALAAPAPLDLRANTLKAPRDKLLASLEKSPKLTTPLIPTPYAPDGVRIGWSAGRAFPWPTEPAFLKGWFEVQDEGSQLAALAVAAHPGEQIGDVCAGGGGKTLALAAAMGNSGQIYAYDVAGQRLAAMAGRLKRAGARNVQMRFPEKGGAELDDLKGKLDAVLVDAPCTGSGTWRRAPDTKWRVKPAALAQRQAEQQQALDLGAGLVKPGGRLIYVTCSVLPEENEDAILAFLGRAADFTPAPLPEAVSAAPGYARGLARQFTPRLTGCDGFFVAALRRTT